MERTGETIQIGHRREQVRGENTEHTLERSGAAKQYRTATGESGQGETVKNGHWRNRARGESTERPLGTPGEGRLCRKSTGDQVRADIIEHSLERADKGRQYRTATGHNW